MDKKKIEEMINEKYKNADAQQLEKYKEEGKKQKRLHIVAFLSWMIVVCCGITGAILFEINKMSLTFPIFFIIIGLIGMLLAMKPKQFKWDYEQWAKWKDQKEIEKVEKAVEDAQNKLNEMKQINGKNIKSAKIIDSYTEMSSKLHGFLNYEEIIQTRVYKFQVTFEDNTTSIITAEEGSKNYNKLMNFLI